MGQYQISPVKKLNHPLLTNPGTVGTYTFDLQCRLSGRLFTSYLLIDLFLRCAKQTLQNICSRSLQNERNKFLN